MPVAPAQGRWLIDGCWFWIPSALQSAEARGAFPEVLEVALMGK